MWDRKISSRLRPLQESGNCRKLIILGYNICGLSRCIKLPEFITFINGFDIFVLVESHVELKYVENYSYLFPEYDVQFSPAVRVSEFGRASGGIVCGFKKALSSVGKSRIKCSFELFDGYPIILVDAQPHESTLVIIPMYMRNETWQDEYRKLSRLMDSYADHDVLLIGDSNARIGNMQVICEDLLQDSVLLECRQSKDEVINEKGKRFTDLCGNYSLVVANGRSPGDSQGEFTFVGTQGNSVIDVACLSYSRVDSVNDFRVVPQSFSDHLPIQLEMNFAVCHESHKVGCANLKINWTKNDEKYFKDKLEQRTFDEQEDIKQNLGEEIEQLVELIKLSSELGHKKSNLGSTTEFRKPWYDHESKRQKKKVLALLDLHQSSNSSFIKKLYLDERNAYNMFVRNKERCFYENMARSLGNIRYPSEFWAKAKLLRRRSRRSNTVSCNILELKEHFKGLLNLEFIGERVSWVEPWISVQELDRPFTLAELKSVIGAAKCGKAPGYDCVPFEFFKHAPENFLERLLRAFNAIYSEGCVPESFSRALIFPLKKKLNLDGLENVRGISFINSTAKLLTGMVLGRLVSFVESKELLNTCQAGFRRTYSTADNIFILKGLAEIRLSTKGQKLYSFFVDFSSAFDRVDRPSLFQKMYCLGLSSQLVRFVEALYRNTEMAVMAGGKTSEWFRSRQGLRQGCLLSPYLFAIFLNDLWEHLGGGVMVNGVKIRMLAYADDVVLLASSPSSLQGMINDLEEYCKTWNLVVNMKKSKIVVFRNGGRPAKNERWLMKGEPVTVVKTYKYLGVTMSGGLSMEHHFRDKGPAAIHSVSALWGSFYANNKVPLEAKYKVFDATASATVLYAAQVWGHRRYEGVEQCQFFFLRRVFGLPASAPHYIMLLETGRGTMFLRSLGLHAVFIQKVLKQPNTRLTKLIAKEVIGLNISWAADWIELAGQMGGRWDWGQDVPTLKRSFVDLQERLGTAEREGWVRRASLSAWHNHYYMVQRNTVAPPEYLNTPLMSVLRWCFKARTGLMYLNCVRWRSGQQLLCALCNLKENEDVLHFLATCPILAEIRKKWFGCARMSSEECRAMLCDNKCYSDLASYCRESWMYRWSLIREFNY
uniref:RNA-directed DNA polymerase from mobile element jockey n=1 Tax=Lygus hesperus TaxID=30085 RepID=A0A0A9Z5B5_LYGHE